MLFNHKLYGKCTLIPNFEHDIVECSNKVKFISYVDLETGEIRESGTHDAGLFHFNEPNMDTNVLVEYGYCKYPETTIEANLKLDGFITKES